MAYNYQGRVRQWVEHCFGKKAADDKLERSFRFLEEALELVQTQGLTKEQALRMADYVYGRPFGDPAQEVGGVSVTLAALCSAIGVDAESAAEDELKRIWTKVEEIRERQASKCST